MGKRRGGKQHLSRGSGQAAHAGCHELLEALGHREGLARRVLAGTSRERPRHLQREEGVPAGGVGQPREQWARQRRPEPRLDQVVQRRERQRSGSDPPESFLGQRTRETEGQLSTGLRTTGDQHPQPRRQAANRERECFLRGRVEPLHIVHRHEHGSLRGKRGEHGDERRCRRPRVSGLVRLGAQESRSEGALLHGRKHRPGLVEGGADQIGERGVRELGLATPRVAP